MNREQLASLAILLGGAVWGLYWLPINHINANGVGSYWAIVLVMAVTVAAFAPIALLKREIVREQLSILLLVGVLGGFSYNFYATSFLTTDVIRAVFLFYLLPVWAAIFGRLLLQEPIHFWRAVAIVVGFAGLWLLMGGLTAVPLPQNRGDIYAFVGGIFFGLFATIIRRHNGLGAFGMNTAVFTFGFLIAIAQALIFMPSDLPTTSAVWQSVPTGIALVLLIILPGNVAILWGAKFVSPTTTSIMMMAEVAVATISAALLLGTEMGTVEILGGLIIVLAGFLDVWGERATAQQQATAAEYAP